MKKWTKNLILICVFLPALAKTQQIGVNSLYHDVMSYYNPAFTGTQYQLRGGIHYRNQWTKLNGAPVNYFGQYEQNFDSLNSGIGIVLMREEIGFSTFQTALVSYRYELKLSNLNRLSFGISGGFNNHTRDPFWIVMNPDDPYLNIDKVSQTKFTLNIGALLTLNRLRIGLSALQLNRANYDKISYPTEIHPVLTLDYKWRINRKFNLEPSVFVITNMKKTSLTTILKANYNNKYWFMGGYRSEDAIIFGAGVILYKKFSLGYGLDIRMNKLSSNAHYSHGAYLNFQIQRRSTFETRTIGTPAF